MASKEILSISERHKNFNDGLSTKLLKDIRRTSGDTFKTKERYYKEEVVKTSNQTSFGTEHVFRIDRSDQFVSRFMLEFNCSGASTTKNHWAVAAIDYIQIEMTGVNNLRYSGLSLATFLLTVNTDNQMKEFLADMWGDALTTTALGQKFTPIVGPGSSGVIKGYGDMGQNAAWPVGKQGSDLIIKIGLRAASALETTSGVLTLDSLKLRYDRYVIKGEIGIPTTSAGRQIIYSYNFVYFQETDIIKATTSGNEDSLQIDNIITDGDLQFLTFFAVIDGEYVTNTDHFNAQAIVAANFKIKGSQTVWSVSSLLEKQVKNVQDFKGKALFPTNSTHFYNIPISPNFCWNVKNLGSPGVNLNLENPTLNVTAIATDTVRYHVLAVYKCVYNLYSDKTAKEVIKF